jgi:hypothetical protein
VAFIPPTAVPWFRGIVMAHIEFTANGVLMVVVGLLAHELRLGSTALTIWFWSLLIGTWTNGATGLVGAFAGQSSTSCRQSISRFLRQVARRIRS